LTSIKRQRGETRQSVSSTASNTREAIVPFIEIWICEEWNECFLFFPSLSIGHLYILRTITVRLGMGQW
jgi:hypothetical protein